MAAAGTDLACAGLGRDTVIRAARFVLWRARLDGRNDPAVNGEPQLQRWIIGLSPHGQPVTVVDVGANVGQWSAAMLGAARQAGRLGDLDLHAFEPSSYTFARLTAALSGQPATLRRIALSDRSGSAVLHVVAPGAGTNSLHPSHDTMASQSAETVTTTTLDAYAQLSGIGEFTLVKVDAEGHDMAILRGAASLFSRHRISVAQFEYNQRWIYSRSFLRDVFDFLKPLGYRLGKVTPRGVEFYPAWDPDLETFVEGNYVACLPAVAQRLPSVSWWKLR